MVNQQAPAMGAFRKDPLDVATKLATLVIAASAVLLASENYKLQATQAAWQNDLSRQNRTSADAQVKLSLIQGGISADSRTRSLVLHLAETLDEGFAVRLAQTFAAVDQDVDVRGTASAVLNRLETSSNQAVREAASSATASLAIVDEMRRKGQLERIADARAYAMAGGDSGLDKALAIYLAVVGELSEGARSRVDAALLQKAMTAAASGNTALAAASYGALFAKLVDVNN